MKIVLDTNILRKDLLATSSDFRLLFDYLERAEADIVLPQIVWEELSACYARALSEAAAKLERGRRAIASVIVGCAIPVFEFDIHREVEKYLEHARSLFRLSECNIIPYKDEYLPELVKRACNRIRPFDENGDGFRDTILWLCTLDLAADSDEEPVVLISGDKTFSDGGDVLRPELAADAEEREVEIEYYVSLSGFLRSRAAKTEYITATWLQQRVDEESVRDELREDMIGIFGNGGLEKLVRSSLLWTNPAEVEVRDVEVGRVMVSDFFVYEMADGSLCVRVSYECNIDVECDLHSVASDEIESSHTVRAEFNVFVRNGDVTNLEYLEWYAK